MRNDSALELAFSILGTCGIGDWTGSEDVSLLHSILEPFYMTFTLRLVAAIEQGRDSNSCT
jgi:hypothetical protein